MQHSRSYLLTWQPESIEPLKARHPRGHHLWCFPRRLRWKIFPEWLSVYALIWSFNHGGLSVFQNVYYSSVRDVSNVLWIVELFFPHKRQDEFVSSYSSCLLSFPYSVFHYVCFICKVLTQLKYSSHFSLVR